MYSTQALDGVAASNGHAGPTHRVATGSDRSAPRRPPGAEPWNLAFNDTLLRQDDPGPLTVAWRDRWRLLLIAAVVGATVYALSAQMSPVYAAETTLAFPYTGSEVALPGGDAERSRSLRTEAERMTSRGLLEQAAASMTAPPDIATLEQSVEAIPATSADVITIRATAPTATHAAAIADAVAAAYRRQVDWRQQTSIDDLEQRTETLQERISTKQNELAAQLEDATARTTDETPTDSDAAVSALRLTLEASVTQLSDLQQRLDEVQAQQATGAGGIQILQPADVPQVPEQPRPGRNAATAVILALMAVTTVRWWRADPEPPRLEDAQAAEALLDAPVIGEIPYLRRPAGQAGIVADRYPEVIDAYRMVAACSPVRGSVLVTAAHPDESCSDLVLNIAATLSRDGYRVLAVEGDPHVGQLRGRSTDQHPGLTDMAAGRAELGPCILAGAAGRKARMGLIPWGTGRAGLSRTLGSGVATAIEKMAAHADVVLIDGPPLAASADALTLAGHVDGLLLAVSTGTSLADLRRLRARLDQLDRRVIGVVVQHTTSRRRSRRRRGPTTTPVRWTSATARDGTRTLVIEG